VQEVLESKVVEVVEVVMMKSPTLQVLVELVVMVMFISVGYKEVSK
jgi:hypothetical protein